MKKLSIIMSALVLLVSCSKESDDMATPSSLTQVFEKSLAKPRPFNAIFNGTADPNSPPTSCSGDVPFAAPNFFMSGDASHLGGINPQLSIFHHVSCDVSSATML